MFVITVVEYGLQGEPDLGWYLSISPQSSSVDIVEPGPLAVVGELEFLGSHRPYSLVGYNGLSEF